MQIKKEYKAYMGHRNQDLKDKCFRPHGHDYKIFIIFNVQRKSSISTLFGDFDSKIEPLLKNEYDHRFLIDKNDKLYKTLIQHDEDLGLKVLDFPSSVENLCYQLFGECMKFNFDVDRIELQETRSSTLVYTKQDYYNDKIYFARQNFTKIPG